MPGNAQHVAILQKMGISVAMLPDGKLQLLQTQTTANSIKDATVGLEAFVEGVPLCS